METQVVLNGIDGTTGNYLIPPFTVRDAAAILSDPEAPDSAADREAAEWLSRIADMLTQPHLGLPYDVRPEVVEEAGWGLLCPADEAEELKAALEPLIAHRRTRVMAGRFRDDLVYHPGETWSNWLARYGVAAGTVDPDHVPYYILVAGDPATIPFGFCHQLDIEYAVGRLHFTTAAEYTRYAASVVAYETGGNVPNGREVVFFSPRHEFDAATRLSADLLVAPLADGVAGSNGAPALPTPAARRGFRTKKLWGAEATKEALRDVFVGGEEKPPAVVFTASHGMGWPLGHPRQVAESGALLCQDWPGLGTVGPEHYFAASDVPDEARPAGMIMFHFACYGAGTPQVDRFFHKPGEQPPAIAEAPFLAALPQRLLSHPKGGALACVGHVERAWGYSIAPMRAGAQLLPFENFLGRVFLGQPVGHATKDLNERFAVLGAALSTKLEQVSFGRKYPDVELATDWIERNDAEGYLLVGDPAVTIRVDDLT
jgi:hypothetical protein